VDTFKIADKSFSSRLIVGTGKYASPAVMVQAHEASGADMVTVAVRRVNISDRSKESLLDYIDTAKYFLLPNTAGCYTADEAIRTARLGREAGLSNWVKLEVIGDERTLFPDNTELLEATRVLVREGFVVLPYTSDDPVICRKLEDAGSGRGDAARRSDRLGPRHPERK
jgi:thiazole synthase